MTRILREAAAVRDGIERARSAEDALLAKQQAEAFTTFVAARDWSTEVAVGSSHSPIQRGERAPFEQR